jgi:hypothetical protein
MEGIKHFKRLSNGAKSGTEESIYSLRKELTYSLCVNDGFKIVPREEPYRIYLELEVACLLVKSDLEDSC